MFTHCLTGKPNVPDYLKVVARTDTSITISWLFVKKNKLATNFTISYRKKNEFWESLETDPLIGNFKFTIQSLQPDTVYEIKLNSRNRNGQSKWTTILDQRTQQSGYNSLFIFWSFVKKWINRHG